MSVITIDLNLWLIFPLLIVELFTVLQMPISAIIKRPQQPAAQTLALLALSGAFYWNRQGIIRIWTFSVNPQGIKTRQKSDQDSE